ncbi:MAG TPA: IclR family transcriptional regulator C-terminal domain-containing protein [Trueperaceae bacterium]|nr:IclR family transcriptional regulator C-terminal domain-containing protein [Trueperaceae bacterium]
MRARNALDQCDAAVLDLDTLQALVAAHHAFRHEVLNGGDDAAELAGAPAEEVDDEEFALGARCVAVGLRGTSNAVSSVISVSGPTMRVTDDVLPAVARLVLEAAERFSRQLREP